LDRYVSHGWREYHREHIPSLTEAIVFLERDTPPPETTE
jgi:hypothetical protein